MTHYEFDLWGWLVGPVSEMALRTTELVPPNPEGNKRAYWTGTAWILREYVVPESVPAMPETTPRKLTKLEYAQRFTLTEEVGIRTMAKTDAMVEVILSRLALAEFVDLDDSATRQWLGYLESQGLLTAARVMEILA